MNKNKKDDEDYRRYLGLIGMPFVLIAAPVCGYFIGYWLDTQLNTKPYLAYIFLGFGVIACIRELYRIFTTFGKDDN